MSLFLAKTVAGGRRAGIAALTGASLGYVVHSLLAAFGLSALIAASPTLSSAQDRRRGLSALARRRRRAQRLLAQCRGPSASSAWPSGRRWRWGFTVNLTNPKVVLFFVTFLPQFVDAHDPHAAGKLLFLGIYFVVLTYPLGRAADPRRRARGGRPQVAPAPAARHRLAVRRRVQRLRRAHPRHAGTLQRHMILASARSDLHRRTCAVTPAKAGTHAPVRTSPRRVLGAGLRRHDGDRAISAALCIHWPV